MRLDWLRFPTASNVYVVRRKQVFNATDKTFNGNAIIATVNDPTEIYDGRRGGRFGGTADAA